MSIIGGEIEQLAALEATFDREATVVQELTTTLRRQMESTYWKGPGADWFVSSWTAEYAPALNRLHAALLEAALAVATARSRLIDAGG